MMLNLIQGTFHQDFGLPAADCVQLAISADALKAWSSDSRAMYFKVDTQRLRSRSCLSTADAATKGMRSCPLLGAYHSEIFSFQDVQARVNLACWHIGSTRFKSFDRRLVLLRRRRICDYAVAW